MPCAIRAKAVPAAGACGEASAGTSDGVGDGAGAGAPEQPADVFVPATELDVAMSSGFLEAAARARRVLEGLATSGGAPSAGATLPTSTLPTSGDQDETLAAGPTPTPPGPATDQATEHALADAAALLVIARHYGLCEHGHGSKDEHGHGSKDEHGRESDPRAGAASDATIVPAELFVECVARGNRREGMGRTKRSTRRRAGVQGSRAAEDQEFIVPLSARGAAAVLRRHMARIIPACGRVPAVPSAADAAIAEPAWAHTRGAAMGGPGGSAGGGVGGGA